MDTPVPESTTPTPSGAPADAAGGVVSTLLALAAARSRDEALAAALDGAIALSGMDCGGIYAIDPATGHLELAIQRGLSPDFAEAVSSYGPECPSARVVRLGRAISTAYERLLPDPDEARAREGLRAAAVVPVLFEGEAVGSLNVASHTREALREGALPALEALAAAVGQSIALSLLRATNAGLEEALAAERERREREARESLRALAAGVAHTVANIHTAVSLQAGLARVEVPEGSAAEQHLGAILRSSKRAGRLCDGLLAYLGQQSRRDARVDLAAMAVGAERLLEAQWPAEVELALSIEGTAPALFGDPRRLGVAVSSLVANAVEALDGRRGTVRVTVQGADLRRGVAAVLEGVWPLPDGLYAALSVSDDGPGMDGETLRRAPEPLFTTKLLGRGLGLAAADGIVRDHGGALRLASSPGEGTTATILLPAAPDLL